MSFDLALRLVELGLALALVQRGAEHVAGGEKRLFLAQIVLAVLLAAGLWRAPVLVGLWGLGVVQLHRFAGPYNGGADKMAFLILTCTSLAHLAPGPFWREMALAYLAVQLVLSYVISGWVKLINPAWRQGRALGDVFAFSAYPASEHLRGLAGQRALLLAASWAVIGLEIGFPLALFSSETLVVALVLTALFHLGNALCLGLNRFFWIWISAYPALIWFQDRVVG